MKTVCLRVSLVAVLAMILTVSGTANAQTFYRLGDVNSDGWCTFADVVTLVEYFKGSMCPNFNMDAADVNGNGSVNAIDLVDLQRFLMGTGVPPVGINSCPIVTCDPNETAYIELRPISDFNPLTATFQVSIASSATISELHFSIPYDPAVIASFSATGVASPNVVYFSPTPRPFVPPDDIIAVTYYCYNNGPGATFPTLTYIFNLVLTAAPGATNVDLKVIEDDPIYGPPRFSFGTSGFLGCGTIFPFSPLQLLGDVNGSGSVNGIDVSYFVGYLKGGPKPIGRYFWNFPVDWGY
jgi:hypothetical protein